jgi:hypothetical protein
MALYKNVNGENILMSAEEETAHILDQQNITNAYNLEKQAEANKETKKASGKQKLKDLGLDDDEIKALTGK